jgi:hypothetical protein
MAKRSENQSLFNLETPAKPQGPVECLGMTFENDEARRAHFLGLLREGLEELHAKLGGVPFTTVEDAYARMKSVEKWPMGGDGRLRELAERMRHADSSKDLLQRWKDEVGFPHGEIEDILNLSDPPYYTACPNPFIVDFIKHYGKPYDPNVPYSKEPFAADVSEGKNDPIYNAHSYHTKVPHKAIMRYILHYTEPGDVVFDGFCGTGMTGVAAQLCGDRKTVESLGYRVDDQGVIYQQETDENGRAVWMPFSKLGTRRAVLNDLSPIATFISSNYNDPIPTALLRKAASDLIEYLKTHWGWMYDTLHTDGKSKGRIHYVIWSDVFVCPSCTQEIVFFDSAYSTDTGKVQGEFHCPHCNTALSKRTLERATETYFDPILRRSHKRNKQVPVLINYSVGGKRHEKTPTEQDHETLKKIDELLSRELLCSHPMMHKGGEGWGAIWRAGYHFGITHTHHFYTTRNFLVLNKAWERCTVPHLRWAITSILNYVNKKQSFTGGGGGMPGVLYIASLVQEKNVIEVLERKIRSLLSAFDPDFRKKGIVTTTTQSSGVLECLEASSVDYIFVDPPFGGNIMYSEGSFLWESWLRVFTNTGPEAIENPVQQKRLVEYQELMTRCFREFFRVLKPGRWMTVEFHNSQNRVWNAIQESLQHAGFVVADVRTLDKKQGSFKQVTSGGAVKQDLVISAYKPNGGLEERFKLTAGTEEGVWDFVRTHLKQLPVFVSKNGQAEVIAERQNYLLFDRMVAFHVQRGVTVPRSAAEFYAGLAQRFPERDGMYFLPEQVAEYDRKRMKVKEVLQLQLFVTDEASAIQWLKASLTKKPQTFQELHPQFLKEIGGWQKHEKPLELSELLEQNFLRYDGKGEVPSQIHSYLSSNFKELRNLPKDHERLRAKAKDRWYVPDPNKAGDLEKLRERALLREFEEYRESKQKRLKVFRLEAVRAGFKKAWAERDYATIIAVARKIPEKVLQEDPKLLMWYDQALTRSGEDA